MLFAISNANEKSVVRSLRYRIQIEEDGEWRNLKMGEIASGDGVIKGRSLEVVSIPTPTNRGNWRVAFPMRETDGVLYGMATELLLEAQKLGLPTTYRRRSRGFVVHTDTVLTER